jgi:hypothetical protein
MSDFRFHKEPDVKKLNTELKERVSSPSKNMMAKYPLLFKQKAR